MKMLTGCSSQIGRVVVALALAGTAGLPAAHADTLFLEEFEGTIDGGDVSAPGNLANTWTKVVNQAVTYSHVLVDSGWSAVDNSGYGYIHYYDNTDVSVPDLSTLPGVELTAVVFNPRTTIWVESPVVLRMGADIDQTGNAGDQISMSVTTAHDFDAETQLVNFTATDGGAGGTATTGWMLVGAVTHPAKIQKWYDIRARVTTAASEFFYREHGESEWIPLGTLDGITADIRRITFEMYSTAGCVALDTIRLVTVPPPTPSGTVVVVR